METKSYLGGLITGEGHFGLTVRKTKQGLQVNPTFVISMADKDTIEYVVECLKELGLPIYRSDKDAKRYGSKKQQYKLAAEGHKRVRRYCEVLMPYLTGDKKRSAEIVLKFIESRLDRPQGQGIKAPYTDDEIGLVNQIRAHHGRSDLVKNHL